MHGPCWCGAARGYATARTDYFLVGKGCALLLLGIKYNPSNDSRVMRSAVMAHRAFYMLTWRERAQVLRPAPQRHVYTP